MKISVMVVLEMYDNTIIKHSNSGSVFWGKFNMKTYVMI